MVYMSDSWRCKSTPYAAVSREAAGKAAMDHGMKTVSVDVKGPGPGTKQP